VIRLPVVLVVAQWALLGGLAMLVLILYRQLAYLTHLRRTRDDAEPAPARAQAGESFPPDIQIRPYRQGSYAGFQPLLADARPTILLFADPQCVACAGRVEHFARLRVLGELDGVSPLVLTDASQRELRSIAAFRDADVPIAWVDGGLISQLGVEATPYYVTIDDDGRVLSRGVAETDLTLAVAARELAAHRDRANAAPPPGEGAGGSAAVIVADRG
jgi:hypothetical protein